MSQCLYNRHTPSIKSNIVKTQQRDTLLGDKLDQPILVPQQNSSTVKIFTYADIRYIGSPTSNIALSNMPPKAVSDAERQAIRAYYFSQKLPLKQKEVITQFKQQYSYKLGQATISDSLKDRYKHLDTALAASSISFRHHSSRQELLKKILFLQQQQLKARRQLVSSEILQTRAKDLQDLLPKYAGKPMPKFLPGWLGKFKKRFNLKQYVQYGEIASVPITTYAKINLLCQTCLYFLAPYIYNIDETGLYWRQVVSKGLTTALVSSVKKDKARISLALYSNATRSNKLPLQLIGKLKILYALRPINIPALGL